jgi:hypothetical protein
VRTDSGHHQQHDISEGYAERDLQHSLGTAPGMSVDMHTLSVRGAGTGFKRCKKVISGHWSVISESLCC